MSYSLVSSVSIVLFLTSCLYGRLSQGQDPCSSEDANSIQLNSTGIFSSVEGSGRVEICVCSTDTSCFWQTVSTGSQTVPFSWKNSIVACRELGFYDVESPILQNSVPDIYQAPDSVGIFEHTFLCDGTESQLSDCAQGSLSSSNTHQADAYINCQLDEVHGRIRLTGSTTEGQGVVEYYHSTTIGNGSWLTVCPDFWLSSESDIFCKFLGYESGSLQKHSRTSFNGPNIETAPGIQSVSCPGSGYYFAFCTITFNGICADVGNLAGVNCVSNNAPDGSARLYQTSVTSVYSRMEVLYGGRWGTVCNIRWNIEDAQVACRELNRDLTGTTIPSFETDFIVASSSRPIWIIGYNCEGGESTLRDCARPSFPVGFPSVSCSHSNDAGLTCGALIIPPKPFPPGGIAGIVIGISVVLIVIFVIVFNDKWKKGEVQAWYRPRRDRWRHWYTGRRERFRQWRQAHHRAHPQTNNETISSSLAMSSTPGPQEQPQTQPVPAPAPVAETHNNPDLPGFDDSQFTVAPPPTYNDALQFQHVKPPPGYVPPTEEKLPYPVSSEFDPAHPPIISGPPPPPGFVPGL